jgi:hypothetical protein
VSAIEVLKMVIDESSRIPAKLICAPDVWGWMERELPGRPSRSWWAGVEVVEAPEMARGAWLLVDREGRPVAKGQGAVM